MQYKKVQSGFLVRLEKGEEINSRLIDFVKEKNLKSGFISAIGAVSSIELGYYHLSEKEYSWKKYEEDLEIVSLTGNVAFSDNEPMIHLHGVFANKENNCFGGHVKEAVVGATCEVYLADFAQGINRKLHDEIGLKLLDLED